MKLGRAIKFMLLIAIVASLAGGYVYTLWLKTDNDRLEEQKVMLEVRKQELESQLQDIQADNIYLKEQAIKENIFLTDRPVAQ